MKKALLILMTLVLVGAAIWGIEASIALAIAYGFHVWRGRVAPSFALLAILAMPVSAQEPIVQGIMDVDSVTWATKLYYLEDPPPTYPVVWAGNRPWMCTETREWPFPPTGAERGWSQLHQEPYSGRVRADLVVREQTFVSDPNCNVFAASQPPDPDPPPPPQPEPEPEPEPEPSIPWEPWQAVDSLPVPYAIATGGAFWHVLVDWDQTTQHTTIHGGLREAGLRKMECAIAGTPCEVQVCSDTQGDGFCYRMELRWLPVVAPPVADTTPSIEPEPEPEPTPLLQTRTQTATGSGTTAIATFPNQPAEGSLLVAVLWHRLNWQVPELISGREWTPVAWHVEDEFEVGSAFRKGVSVWVRRAGPNEPQVISATWSDMDDLTRDVHLALWEFEGYGGFVDATIVSTGATQADHLELIAPGPGALIGLAGTREGVTEAIWDGLEGSQIRRFGEAGVDSSILSAVGIGNSTTVHFGEMFTAIGVLLRFNQP